MRSAIILPVDHQIGEHHDRPIAGKDREAGETEQKNESGVIDVMPVFGNAIHDGADAS